MRKIIEYLNLECSTDTENERVNALFTSKNDTIYINFSESIKSLRLDLTQTQKFATLLLMQCENLAKEICKKHNENKS